MAGGGTTVTKTEPWDAQKDYLTAGFGRAQDLYNLNPMGPSYYQGPTLAGFDPAQQASQRMTMNYAMGTRPQAMQRGAEASLMQGLSGQVDRAAFDPLASALGSKVQSQLTGNILPGIRESLVRYQPGGSSRGDLVQNKAISDAVTSGMTLPLAQSYADAYGTAQQRATQAGQLYPTMMNAPLAMGQAVGDVGQARRSMTQEGINRAMARDQYTKNVPQQALANYMSMISGDYGGTTSQTAPSDYSPIIGALGSIASAFITSDERLKENIEKVGSYKGLNVYEYNYLWSPTKWVGFIAQEVEKIIPEAVFNVNGFKVIDYGKIA